MNDYFIYSIGLTAQLLFSLRLLIQWLFSEKENKVVAHIAVLLTLLILIALVGMRLPKSLNQGGLGLLRVLLMIGTSTFSMVYFVKSFSRSSGHHFMSNLL